jgi:hypothetical protein
MPGMHLRIKTNIEGNDGESLLVTSSSGKTNIEGM